jgi:60 kDa SS-A/Ro ribonucleoprotein
MLDRFLIMGVEGNSYYVNQQQKFDRNSNSLKDCLAEDPCKVIARVVEISQSGRAVKNDQAIFALAMASLQEPEPIMGDKIREYAYNSLQKVCRTGTHLYQWCAFRDDLKGGWGKGARKAVSSWFNDKSASSAAYQVAKYANREGYTARDVLRLAHPIAKTPAHDAIYQWVVSGHTKIKPELPEFLQAVEEIKEADASQALALILKHELPWEVIPTNHLNNPMIWKALLQKMGTTAMIRNLAKMTSIGVINDYEYARKVAQQISSKDVLKKDRIHPISLLMALAVYKSGKGIKGDLTWTPNQAIKDALNDGFYEAFNTIEPTGKRTLIGLDVSGSMSSGSMSAKFHMSPREITSAMAMVTMRTEKSDCLSMAFSNGFIPVPFNRNDSLETVMESTKRLPFMGTDCSLPMLFALQNKIMIDTFIIYTDNDTNSGSIHPAVALDKYRQMSGIPAKLIVCATELSEFSVADPDDAGSIDIAGFDSSVPQIISEFSKGSFDVDSASKLR